VGEHSFSSLEVPIAQGRPDKEDLVRAEAFGQHVAAQLQALDLAEIPGNRPYKDNPVFPGAAAESDPEHCIRCGQCVEVCPADAITMSAALPETNAEECLWCEACVRACPTQSRAVVLPKIREVAERLHQTCSERREPSCYFEDAQC
ncbi:MAG: 4Fe-4S binding protein, partial [Pontiellaceae bacterium]|nr:4Fe-4S binding protein [Pontiellaceae bacterium]